MKKSISALSVGKIILMGEHSVVYGRPALSIPFPAARVKTTINEIEGEARFSCYFYEGSLKDAPDKLGGITSMIEKILESFDQSPKDIEIIIESTVPQERGMGSSAAVSVSVIRALYKYYDRELSLKDQIKWSDFSEKLIHGNPSGLDAATIIGNKSLYFIKGQPFKTFENRVDAYLVVGDSGILGQTREAVTDVRKLVDKEPEKYMSIIDDLARLAEEAKINIEANRPEALGSNMYEAHQCLRELTVSNASLDSLVDAALRAGALGSKLTGGGRGGSMIALCESESKAREVSLALKEAGAIDTWIARLGEDNE